MSTTKLAPRGIGQADQQSKELPVIPLDRMQLREAAVNDWLVLAPRGLELADLEAGAPWSTVAQRLRAYDLVRVVAQDESWWAECIVKFATTGRAILKTLRTVQLGDRILNDDLGVPPGHRIEQGAPGEGWCIYRESDGVTMAKGIDQGNWTRQQALAWLLNNATLTQTLPPRAPR